VSARAAAGQKHPAGNHYAHTLQVHVPTIPEGEPSVKVGWQLQLYAASMYARPVHDAACRSLKQFMSKAYLTALQEHLQLMNAALKLCSLLHTQHKLIVRQPTLCPLQCCLSCASSLPSMQQTLQTALPEQSAAPAASGAGWSCPPPWMLAC
jgi:hypothetical protein